MVANPGPERAMEKQGEVGWKVIYGTVRQGGPKGPGQEGGDVVQLTPKEALEIDPTIKNGVGQCLILESKWQALEAGEKAKQEAIARLTAEHEKKVAETLAAIDKKAEPKKADDKK